MDPVIREVLGFVTPGILHRLGNALFTVQGHAQLLNGIGPEGRERRAILNATERGSRTLALMRSLLGHRPGQPENATQLLPLLTEVLGVPVREHGHTMESNIPDDAVYRGVEPSVFCPAVLEAVRLMTTLQPPGQTGRIQVALVDGDAGEVVVQVRFAPTQGNLPFPLPSHELRAGLDRSLLNLRPRPLLRMVGGGVDVRFAGQAGGLIADAQSG